MNEELIQRIRENFAYKLMAKTNWGRNDVMLVFEQAMSESTAQVLDQIQKRDV